MLSFHTGWVVVAHGEDVLAWLVFPPAPSGSPIGTIGHKYSVFVIMPLQHESDLGLI